MPGDQILVGSVSIALSIAALVAASGRWTTAFQLGLVKKIYQRYGNRGAQLFYLALAILLIALGLIIFFDLRPAYALSQGTP